MRLVQKGTKDLSWLSDIVTKFCLKDLQFHYNPSLSKFLRIVIIVKSFRTTEILPSDCSLLRHFLKDNKIHLNVNSNACKISYSIFIHAYTTACSINFYMEIVSIFFFVKQIISYCVPVGQKNPHQAEIHFGLACIVDVFHIDFGDCGSN